MALTSSARFAARLKSGDGLLLAVRRLSLRYPGRDGVPLQALRDVNLSLHEGETLGVVGESGCGKSSLARALVGLERPSAGAINFDGRDIAALREEEWRPLRRQIQLVFQDPLASLDPQMTIGHIVAEPLDALYTGMTGPDRTARVIEMAERVGLSRELLRRFPHELSGGQAQRVAIARALVVRPRLLICDEPVSALDVSVQAQVINLLRDLQRESGLAMVFITHDLGIARHVSHRIMVMYLGRVMEAGETETLFRQPMHPYTQALLAAMPRRDGGERSLPVRGELPDPRFPPSGCVFRTRCALADGRCAMAIPVLKRTAGGGLAACLYAPEPPPRTHAPDEEGEPRAGDAEDGSGS